MLRLDAPLGVHHVAFVRACILGLDPAAAAARYLGVALGAPVGPRRAEKIAGALLREMAGRGRNAAQASVRQAGAALAEAANAPAGAGDAALRALSTLEAALVRAPHADDPLRWWVAANRAEALETAGIVTLDALARVVATLGHHWHRRVPRVGAVTARALLRWLAPIVAAAGRPLPCELDPNSGVTPAQRRARLSAVAEPPRFGIVPIERLAVPTALRGGRTHPGRFSSRMPNHLGASDDIDAMQRWLALYAAAGATHRAYRKEAERFLLWAIVERSVALSSIDSSDCVAYRAFLADVPEAWICSRPVARSDGQWRPFRGALAPASQRQALIVVQAMYDAFVAAGVVVGNPMRAVASRRDGPLSAGRAAAGGAGAPPSTRAFDEGEWAFLQAMAVDGHATTAPAIGASTTDCSTVEHDLPSRCDRSIATDATATMPRPRPRPPPSPAARCRRLRWILALLAGTGLRVAEAAGATTGDLVRVELDDARSAWLLRVVGKGGRPREVPLGDDLLALLRRHHRDVGVDALPDARTSGVPLICALQPPPATEASPTDDARDGSAPRALGAGGIYRVVKRFFRRCARAAASASRPASQEPASFYGRTPLDPARAQRLARASPHWLRHTFGRQMAAEGVPVDVLRQAFGHASLATTSRYVDAERRRMIDVLAGARHARHRRGDAGGDRGGAP